MASSLILGYRDYDGELSTATFPGATISAGNFTAQDGLRDALQAATDDIVIGQAATLKIVAENTNISDLKASNAFAQRETKWLVKYTFANAPGAHSLEIPSANLAYLQPGGKLADLTGTEMAAFVDAFEAFVVDENGNAATVVEIQHVGRNL